MLPIAITEEPVSYDINLPYRELNNDTLSRVKYPAYMPNWDKIWFDPLPPFQFHDPALRVKDTSLPELHKAGIKISHITPQLGSVVSGIQLNRLSDAAKNELAYLVTQRKVLAFEDQDIIDDGPHSQQEFMNYFGKPNYQPVSGTVQGYPGFHIIQRDGNKDELAKFLEVHPTTTLWHQDVSYEIQPPGEVGGDTVFAATDVAYRRLSPAVQSFIDKLQAVHSSSKMINHARTTGGIYRKDAVDTVHPVVRVHPVTGEKCIFMNAEFVTKIVGLKDTEFRMMQDFLMQHVVMGHDFQARVRWSPRSVVIFDNRSCLRKTNPFAALLFKFLSTTILKIRCGVRRELTCLQIPTAAVDYVTEDGSVKLRHLFRLAAMAEKPIPVG